MKKTIRYLLFCLPAVIFFFTCSTSYSIDTGHWTLGPFIKQDKANPCLLPDEKTRFDCPVRREAVDWETKDVFNPAAVVKDGKIFLLYRAEDTVGKFAGTSRIGLAESEDGLRFKRHKSPVLYPDNDNMKKYEWEGGCEDPRIVEGRDRQYYLTYTAWDGRVARLCVATSTDLFHWQKHGPAFKNAFGGKYVDTWSKSGSIVCKMEGEKSVAVKIDDKYWMYWGDTDIFAATSKDLIDWTPLQDKNGEPAVVLSPRQHKFDSDLVEPGPPALLTDNGILLIYNSKNSADQGDSILPAGTYAAGQALLNPRSPADLIARTDHYFFKPERSYELKGQINNVCFLQGLVIFAGRWFLYYGTADSKIAVSTFDP